MSIKEISIEEKYDKLLNFNGLENATSYYFQKEQGMVEKWLDYALEVACAKKSLNRVYAF